MATTKKNGNGNGNAPAKVYPLFDLERRLVTIGEEEHGLVATRPWSRQRVEAYILTKGIVSIDELGDRFPDGVDGHARILAELSTIRRELIAEGHGLELLKIRRNGHAEVVGVEVTTPGSVEFQDEMDDYQLRAQNGVRAAQKRAAYWTGLAEKYTATTA